MASPRLPPAQSFIPDYARLTPTAAPSHTFLLACVLPPMLLSAATLTIFVQAGHDEDPFHSIPSQMIPYLGAPPFMAIAWSAWFILTLRAIRRCRLHPAWIGLAALAGSWGALCCVGHYLLACEFIGQVTRIHGDSYPILSRLYPPR